MSDLRAAPERGVEAADRRLVRHGSGGSMGALAMTTEPRTEAGKAMMRSEFDAFGLRGMVLAIEAEARAAALRDVAQQVSALRALIGPLDPDDAKARADTLDAVLAILTEATGASE